MASVPESRKTSLACGGSLPTNFVQRITDGADVPQKGSQTGGSPSDQQQGARDLGVPAGVPPSFIGVFASMPTSVAQGGCASS